MEKHLTFCNLNCTAIAGAKAHLRLQAKTDCRIGGQAKRHCQRKETLSVVLGQFQTVSSFVATYL
jgi:hypothetical protein